MDDYLQKKLLRDLQTYMYEEVIKISLECHNEISAPETLSTMFEKNGRFYLRKVY